MSQPTTKRRRSGAVSFRALAVAAFVLGSASATVAAGEPCFLSEECADGNFCNGIETCVGGFCQDGAPIPCDDGDACTLDFCDPAKGCGHSEELCPADCGGLGDGERCADGTVCTSGDACSGGLCVPGPPPACPNTGPCVSASCDPMFGCVYTEEFVSGPCVPTCDGTVADFTPCPGDGNLCTLDACLPSTDFSMDFCIENLLFELQCGDGDACNGEEWCSPSLGCQQGPPPVCDDGDACNGVETCDSGSGCQPGTPGLPDGTACDDGLLCTNGDVCASESCGGTPVSPADCDDADAATADRCLEGFGCLNCVSIERVRAKVKFAAPGKTNGKVKIRGDLRPAEGGDIDPGVEPMTLVVEIGAVEIVRATLPAGALEEPKTGSFRYRDKTASAAPPLRTVKIKRRSDGSYRLRAASGRFAPESVSGTSLEVVLPLGIDCFGETSACVSKGGGSVLSCKE